MLTLNNLHQDRSSISSKVSMDATRLHLHSILPPRPFFKLFTRPFRRKSVPSSPALPPKTYRSSSEGPSDGVKLVHIKRQKRLKLIRRRLRKRMDVYVDCRVPTRSVFKKRRQSPNVQCCLNSVVSATNRLMQTHDVTTGAWHDVQQNAWSCTFLTKTTGEDSAAI